MCESRAFVCSVFLLGLFPAALNAADLKQNAHVQRKRHREAIYCENHDPKQLPAVEQAGDRYLNHAGQSPGSIIFIGGDLVSSKPYTKLLCEAKY